MRCQHCKGSVSARNFFIEKHCPACGEKLKKMPTRDQIKESVISFAEDKGYIFWSIAYIILVYIISFFEQIFGSGVLFDYVMNHGWRTFFIAVYSGSIIDYIVKANVEVTAVRNKFIFRPPPYLRHFRRWTNFGVLLGFGLTIYSQMTWPNYMAILPMLSLITSVIVCLMWAFMGLALSDDDMQDKRIRYFMQEMRIGRIKHYHRAAAIYVGGFFLAAITYYWLVRISGLAWYILHARFVYNIVNFFKTYFGWVDQFIN